MSKNTINVINAAPQQESCHCLLCSCHLQFTFHTISVAFSFFRAAANKHPRLKMKTDLLLLFSLFVCFCDASTWVKPSFCKDNDCPIYTVIRKNSVSILYK